MREGDFHLRQEGPIVIYIFLGQEELDFAPDAGPVYRRAQDRGGPQEARPRSHLVRVAHGLGTFISVSPSVFAWLHRSHMKDVGGSWPN